MSEQRAFYNADGVLEVEPDRETARLERAVVEAAKVLRRKASFTSQEWSEANKNVFHAVDALLKHEAEQKGGAQ